MRAYTTSRLDGQRGHFHWMIPIVVVLVAVIGFTGYRLQKLSSAESTTINDRTTSGTNRFTYSGTWYTSNRSSLYNGDNTFSNVTSSLYTVTFTGTQISIYSEKSPGMAIASYTIDNGVGTNVDQYAASQQDNTLVYTSPVLSNGTHTLTVRNTGTKNAASKAYYLVADRAVITTPDIGTTSTATTVTIGSQSFPLAGTNIARGTNQLVRYTYSASQTATPTNQYGIEVTVNTTTGKVTAVNDRLASGSKTGTPIPADSYILSGHGYAAGTAYRWLLDNAKVGATVQVSGASASAPVVTPDSPTNAVIGSSSYALAGTNIPRGTNQLIRYTYSTSQTVTPTNQYGIEVTVNATTGKVTAVNNRLASGSTTGTPIPSDSYILSGHGYAAGTAYRWLLDNAKVGATVQLTGSGGTTGTTTPPVTTPTTPSSPSTGTTSSAPMAYPNKAVALYFMMWSNSGSPKLSTIPSNVNVVNLAFVQNDPPSLVGWASQGESSFIADAKALRARGVRIVVSVGGAGGHINVANRQAFVNNIMALNDKIPLDGIDWDLEGPSMTQSDVVWISTQLKQLRGSNFAVTMAPNGSNVDQYRAVAVALNNAGALDMIGQQFYDAVVTNAAMMTRLDQFRAAGIPENKIGIGMMVGDANTYWTVSECISAVNTAKAKYPNLRGGYLWEAGRAGTADWANQVGSLLTK